MKVQKGRACIDSRSEFILRLAFVLLELVPNPHSVPSVTMIRIFFLITVIIVAKPSGVFSDEHDRDAPLGRQDGHVHESGYKLVDSEFKRNSEAGLNREEIGIVEKLGEVVPLDLYFNNEAGNRISLDEIVNKPTIIALVFLKCRSVCPLLLGGLAGALSNLQLAAGEDYSVITISFDELDTPTVALEAKKNYIAAIGGSYPEKAWRFLTGDKENIKTFTDAVGFTFKNTKRV